MRDILIGLIVTREEDPKQKNKRAQFIIQFNCTFSVINLEIFRCGGEQRNNWKLEEFDLYVLGVSLIKNTQIGAWQFQNPINSHGNPGADNFAN